LTENATALNDPFAQSLAGRRLGRYEVLARLASGGMAAVYVARALGVAGFERLFAIKVLHPHLAHEQEFITMFLDEARLAARIRHPNVVPTIDISDTGDAGYYLVMDYIEGDHLGALLQKAYKLGSKLPTPIALRAMVDALEGLAAAHNLTDENGRRINLVHRDVSPHNIMVSTDGIARLTDFGVAKAEVRLMSTTRQGQFKGKLAYMAPEHASTGEADQRSDLFSAGIILWESLTGRRLFRAENQAATLNKICIEPIPMPSSVDPELAPFDTILAMALARDPAERFQTAEEFAEAIEANAEMLGGLANQRAVGKLVREYAAEKIEHDRELIRVAVAEIGQPSAEHAMEMPAAARDSVHPGLQAGSAFLAPPITLPEPAAQDIELPEPSSSGGGRRFAWLAVGALVLVAVALAVAAALMKETPTVTNVPLAPAAEVPPPKPEPPPVPTLPPVVTAPTPEPTPAPEATPSAAEHPSAAPSTTPSRREEPRRRGPSGTGEKPSAKKPAGTSPDLLLNPYRK
jgi:serine/threonine-protein kinase